MSADRPEFSARRRSHFFTATAGPRLSIIPADAGPADRPAQAWTTWSRKATSSELRMVLRLRVSPEGGQRPARRVSDRGGIGQRPSIDQGWPADGADPTERAGWGTTGRRAAAVSAPGWRPISRAPG